MAKSKSQDRWQECWILMLKNPDNVQLRRFALNIEDMHEAINCEWRQIKHFR
jgi:hypothetical protein